MKEKVIIPNRGVIALDLIDSLKGMGLETILLYSPEDAQSLPVKLADRSFKFYSSRLEDSYLDMDSIIEKALELKAEYIHPGYGFLAENPEFARRCGKNNIKFIGPEAEVLDIINNKNQLRKIARELDIKTIGHSEPVSSSSETERITRNFKFPLVIKPVAGLGGNGIRVVRERREFQDQLDEMLKREENLKTGLFVEEFLPHAHHIELPFFRDTRGNILFLPEIESSVQRRFQKIFQESPSINLSKSNRDGMVRDSKKLVERIGYHGLGYVEFLVHKDSRFFFEINTTFQINTLISEIHMASNFIKKQFAISNYEALHHVRGTEIIRPKHHVLLVSLMAENPIDHFLPSSGTITDFFSYSTIRNVFKSTLFTGARISHLYDPFIGKIVTYAVKRENAINDMGNFLSNINIRGIRTNLHFLRSLLNSEPLARGETTIDFLNSKWDYAKRKKSEKDMLEAAALLSAALHIENQRMDLKAELQKMKQPGFFKRLFRRF
jgi:acetyl/propionyl-CoA carboxylase alpha subunit